MSYRLFFKSSSFLAVLSAAILLSSCGSSSSSSSGGTGSSGSSLGGFAAGIGGAGQASPAQFLIAVQVPILGPIPTTINSSGTLTQAQATVSYYTVFNPLAITGAIDPSGTFFYQAVHPGLWAFTIDRQNGNVTEMSTSPYDDTVNFDSDAVDQLGKFLYAYDDSGNVYAYTIQSGTGQLSPIAGSPFPSESSGEQYAIPSSRIAVSQDDKYLYVATGAGIAAYSIDASTGALTTVSGSPFGASAGLGLALVAPSSGFLYETVQSNTPAGSPVYEYSINSSTGALASLAGSPAGSGCGADMSSPANGKFLFGSGCGMFQIDASTGQLTFLFNDPQSPYDSWATFDPAGGFIWIVTSIEPCFHCDIGVDTYQVDPSTGAMTLVPNSFFSMTDSEVGGIDALAVTH